MSRILLLTARGPGTALIGPFFAARRRTSCCHGFVFVTHAPIHCILVVFHDARVYPRVRLYSVLHGSRMAVRSTGTTPCRSTAPGCAPFTCRRYARAHAAELSRSQRTRSHTLFHDSRSASSQWRCAPCKPMLERAALFV
jgi:hypothetical protein